MRRRRQLPGLPGLVGGSGSGRPSMRAASANSFHSVQTFHPHVGGFLPKSLSGLFPALRQPMLKGKSQLLLLPLGVNLYGEDQVQDEQHGGEG